MIKALAPTKIYVTRYQQSITSSIIARYELFYPVQMTLRCKIRWILSADLPTSTGKETIPVAALLRINRDLACKICCPRTAEAATSYRRRTKVDVLTALETDLSPGHPAKA